jgi:UDP-GlcNAc:undecaprenyl-phosphate/decaprenyl-phosphate GlcNAc-1-phosphate transferase
MAVLRRLLDVPDGDRRSHKKAVPRLGGVAVFAGFVIAVLVGLAAQRVTSGAEPRSVTHIAQLLGACAILFAIGLADDIVGVPPVVKLIGQTAAALVVQYHWALLPAITIPPHETIQLGWLGVPLMVLWLVGMSNALNLVDGLDGLAGGVSVIALITIVAASAILHNGAAPLAAVALAGALVGFLLYNWSPASIFLGDSGSLVVGFLLAFIAVRGSTTHGSVLMILPIFALAYPLLDTGLAMLRRWLRGHALSRADGRHVHHQLLALGLTHRRAASLIYIYAAGVATLGLSVTFAPPELTIAVTIVGGAILALVFLYGVRWLEYHEFVEAGAIFRSAGTLARGAIRDSIQAHDVAKLIEKASSLLEIDSILGSHAEGFGFKHMQVGPSNAPMPLHQGISAKSHWKLEFPIVYRADYDANVDEFDALVLTVWCSKAASGRTASAERVSRVIAAAVADWSLSVPSAVGREIHKRATTPAFGVTGASADDKMDGHRVTVDRKRSAARMSAEHQRVL